MDIWQRNVVPGALSALIVPCPLVIDLSSSAPFMTAHRLRRCLRLHCRYGEQKRARISAHLRPRQLARALSDMSSGRQIQLWDSLAHISSPLLFVAGELDKKFVDIACRMVALVTKQAPSERSMPWSGNAPDQDDLRSGCTTRQGTMPRNDASTGEGAKGNEDSRKKSEVDNEHHLQTEPLSAQAAPDGGGQLGMGNSMVECSSHFRSGMRQTDNPTDMQHGPVMHADMKSSISKLQNVVLVPGAGHACQLERPEAVLAIVASFLKHLRQQD